jgi:hypothetical protein
MLPLLFIVFIDRFLPTLSAHRWLVKPAPLPHFSSPLGAIVLQAPVATARVRASPDSNLPDFQ